MLNTLKPYPSPELSLELPFHCTVMCCDIMHMSNQGGTVGLGNDGQRGMVRAPFQPFGGLCGIGATFWVHMALLLVNDVALLRMIVHLLPFPVCGQVCCRITDIGLLCR